MTGYAQLSKLTLLIAFGFCCLVMMPPAFATRLPGDVSRFVQNHFPDGKVRLDGSIETSDGQIYLPAIPTVSAGSDNKKGQEEFYPEQDDPILVETKNGWCYLKVINRGSLKTVSVARDFPEKLRNHLLACKFPVDLIVPENFLLPTSLKALAGSSEITLVDDATLANPEFGHHKKVMDTAESGKGAIFITSFGAGTITVLDDSTLEKIIEYPTEGTPGSMVVHDGHLYITDQTKNRILILDEKGKEFTGQIDLPPKSAPKGIAAIAGGEFIYTSESGAGDVAVIEKATHKVLMRTKVAPGPSKMALTPTGDYLLVLNVPSGMVTIVSPIKMHSVVATVKVGTLPTSLVITKDGHYAFIANRISNNISILDIRKHELLGSIKTGNGPTGIALSSDESKIYVANARDNTIGIYDTNTREKVDEIRLPLEVDFPEGVILMDSGKKLLITSAASDSICLLELSTKQVEKQTQIGHASNEVYWCQIPQ